jgi:hypothetical protein
MMLAHAGAFVASGKLRPIRTSISTSFDVNTYHKDFLVFGTRAQSLQPKVTPLR